MPPDSPDPQPAVCDRAPQPPSLAQAGFGLTVEEIANRNGHSAVAIYGAIKRFKLKSLVFKGLINLFSSEQADFLRAHMRKSHRQELAHTGSTECLPN